MRYRPCFVALGFAAAALIFVAFARSSKARSVAANGQLYADAKEVALVSFFPQLPAPLREPLPADAPLGVIQAVAASAMRVPGFDARRLFPKLWLCPDNEGFPAPDSYLFSEPTAAYRSQFGEDAELFRDFIIGRSRHATASDPGVFLEIGALDGEQYSNTYFFENALNWRGILIDALPNNARRLLQRTHAQGDRRHSVGMHMAICLPPLTTVRFLSSDPDTSAVGGSIDDMDPLVRVNFHSDTARNRLFSVPCGPIGPYLLATGVRAIDFWSLDVEGAELTVLRTFAWGFIAVHYLLVEVNSHEREITAFLEARGMNVERWMGNSMSVLYVNRTFEEIAFQDLCLRV